MQISWLMPVLVCSCCVQHTSLKQTAKNWLGSTPMRSLTMLEIEKAQNELVPLRRDLDGSAIGTNLFRILRPSVRSYKR